MGARVGSSTWWVMVFCAPLLLAGCGELKELPTAPEPPPVDEPDPTATLTRVQTEIFTPTCAVAGCHDNFGGLQSGLILTAGRSHEQLVNKPSIGIPSVLRVRPGDPENSYVYRKIRGVNIIGDRMPQGSSPLSQAHQDLIRDWIRRGAPND
jgi:hypothetical protein